MQQVQQVQYHWGCKPPGPAAHTQRAPPTLAILRVVAAAGAVDGDQHVEAGGLGQLASVQAEQEASDAEEVGAQRCRRGMG